ncbi:MAG: general secretion pathway protein GspE [Deltaproteobacteria bacterium]|nr:general secretion pathway protein GspE [Deltaproteobacteria bacterium]
MVQRIKLGELLVRAGVITDARLKAALAEQKRWGGRLGKILVDMNFVSEDLMVKALSKQLALPMAKLDGAPIPREILSKIDPDFAQLNSICPERYVAERRALVVAMADPINVHAIDELSRMTGLRIEPTIGGERALAQAIARTFGRAYSEISPETFTDNTGAQLLRDGVEVGMPPTVTERPVDLFPGAGLGASGLGMPTVAMAPPSMGVAPSGVLSNAPAPAFGGTVEGFPSYPPAPIKTQSASDVARSLEEAQKKQFRAIRAMVELMIEKGVFSRDEYAARVSRR